MGQLGLRDTRFLGSEDILQSNGHSISLGLACATELTRLERIPTHLDEGPQVMIQPLLMALRHNVQKDPAKTETSHSPRASAQYRPQRPPGSSSWTQRASCLVSFVPKAAVFEPERLGLTWHNSPSQMPALRCRYKQEAEPLELLGRAASRNTSPWPVPKTTQTRDPSLQESAPNLSGLPDAPAGFPVSPAMPRAAGRGSCLGEPPFPNPNSSLQANKTDTNTGGGARWKGKILSRRVTLMAIRQGQGGPED